MELSTAQSASQVVSPNTLTPANPLLARVYLKLGTWQRELTPILDDNSIQGI